MLISFLRRTLHSSLVCIETIMIKCNFTKNYIKTMYDSFSVELIICVREMDESEVGQMVLEKVNGPILIQTIWTVYAHNIYLSSKIFN